MTPNSNMLTNIQSYINVLLYMTYSHRLSFTHNVLNWFRIELRHSQNNPNKWSVVLNFLDGFKSRHFRVWNNNGDY